MWWTRSRVIEDSAEEIPVQGFLGFAFVVAFIVSAQVTRSADRMQDFAKDPQWDPHRNRLMPIPYPAVRQDFGFCMTNHAKGRKPGEIGGWFTRAVAPSYYARVIKPRTLNDKLTASGRLP
jgi:hypothetical protein